MKLLPHYIASYKSPVITWTDLDINDRLLYSNRCNHFNRSTFPSDLHFHDYYELVIFTGGNICYVCENNNFIPEPGDVIVIAPGKLHMSIITADETVYSRHVFYFYPDVFAPYGCDVLLDFNNQLNNDRFFFTPSPATREKLFSLLAELERHLKSNLPLDHALAVSFMLQIFYLFNQPAQSVSPQNSYLPSSVVEIQHYIDEHFTDISSISDVASHFFYSREHVSRLFKKYLNTTVADYILKRRVSYSRQLIESDMSLTDICFQAGFGSVQAFIHAFKSIIGITPSQYRRSLQQH